MNPFYTPVRIPFLTSLPANTYVIGQGFPWWFKQERHTDRYGSIWLSRTRVGNTPSPIVVRDLGSKGKLIARILEVSPWPLAEYYVQTQRCGQLVPLGQGRSFVADFGEPPLALGVKPTTGRKYNWLSSDSLHFVQHCRVHLLWAPFPS